MNEKLSGGRKIGSAKLDTLTMATSYTQLGPYIRQGGEAEPCPQVLGVREIPLAPNVIKNSVLGVTSSQPMKPRTYKVSRRFTPRRYDNTETPFIRLSGEWLAAAGFPIAGKLKAEVSQGRIILTAV